MFTFIIVKKLQKNNKLWLEKIEEKLQARMHKNLIKFDKNLIKLLCHSLETLDKFYQNKMFFLFQEYHF